MADVEKLWSTTGIFDYPDISDLSKGTTEQQYQDWVKNHHDVLNDVVSAHLWQPDKEYKVGEVVESPNMVANTVARVLTAGTTSNAEPVWSAAGNTVGDGTVTWAILYRTIDYATQDEVTAGTNSSKIVTPAMLGKTVQTDLASENPGTLNGSDKSVVGGVTGILPITHGGTGSDHLPYTPFDGAWDGTHFPIIDSDGVSEIGRILDFHEGPNDGRDYSLRMESRGNRLFVNGTDIMQYIANVQSGAGVIAGNVSNANAWWVKLGGAIPLIIQGGYVSIGHNEEKYVSLPIAFTALCAGVYLGRVNSAHEVSPTVTYWDTTSLRFRARGEGGAQYGAESFWFAVGR